MSHNQKLTEPGFRSRSVSQYSTCSQAHDAVWYVCVYVCVFNLGDIHMNIDYFKGNNSMSFSTFTVLTTISGQFQNRECNFFCFHPQQLAHLLTHVRSSVNISSFRRTKNCREEVIPSKAYTAYDGLELEIECQDSWSLYISPNCKHNIKEKNVRWKCTPPT